MCPNELRRPGVNVEEDQEVNVDAVQWLRTMAERGHDVDEVGQIAAVVGQIAQRAGGPEWRDWHPAYSGVFVHPVRSFRTPRAETLIA